MREDPHTVRAIEPDHAMKRTLALLLLLATATGAFAQADPHFTEKVNVNYVIVPFVALGSKGIPIMDITPRNIALYVDGQPVDTDMFELAMNAPVSWTILFDASGSMGVGSKMEAAKSAIRALISRRQEGDDFGLFVFDSKGTARELVPYTENPAAITRALDVVKPWGRTAFYDALSEMPERSELGRNASRAILLLSDGIDNASRLTREQIEKLMEGVATPIYAFALREAGEKRLKAAPDATPEQLEMGWNLDLLEELAAATGGQVFVGNQPEKLAAAMDGIGKVLRAQYLVGFSPTGKGGIKYRRFTLKVGKRTSSLRVRAGYRGTEAPILTAASRKKMKNERKVK